MTHDFKERLAWSHRQSDRPFWGDVYRAAFPDFSTMHDVREDGWAQRGGIDRQVLLKDGTVLKIDEKARDRRDGGDILLEVWTDDSRETPGWMEKPLTCDFIAYAFVPSRTCYLLPYQLLRQAWAKHRSHWWATCQHVRAPNRGYHTLSLAVPTHELLTALTSAITVSWQSEAA